MEFLDGLDRNTEMSAEAKAQLCEEWLGENPNHKDSQIAEFYVRMWRRVDEATRRADTLAQERASVSIQALKTKYPVLTDTTISLPYFPKNHRHADTSPVQLDLAAVNVFVSESFPNFWQTSFIGEPENCDSESKAQFFVYNLLTAILKGMNLRDFVEVSMNRTLAGAECDVLLIHKPNRLPFAVLEVKKPGNSEEGRRLVWEGSPLKNRGTSEESGGNRVAGEIYDAMRAVQLFGFATVTGMITTWNQWQIVGLHDDKLISGDSTGDSAASNVRHLFEKFKLFRQRKQTQPVVDNAMNPSFEQSVSPEQKSIIIKKHERASSKQELRREIWASAIIPSHKNKDTNQLLRVAEENGESIVCQLVLFVVKSCGDLQAVLDLDLRVMSEDINHVKICKMMPCRILRQNHKSCSKTKSNVFAFGTVQLKNLNLDTFCKAESIHVIHHLGMGEYGNVCLGTSSKGSSCCAIKFYHNASLRVEFASRECQAWENIYGLCIPKFPIPYLLQVTGGPCLVMPYLHPIEKGERQDLLDQGVLKEVLVTFAKSGFIHRDIKWRHFRRWKKKGLAGSRIVLTDLGEGSLCEHEGDDDAVATWIDKSLSNLQTRAGNTEVSTSSVDRSPSLRRSKRYKRS
jgi:hypothetical protein